MNIEERIQYEDQDIILVHKPAGLATQTAKLGQKDLVSELRNYLSKTTGSSYIGVVHRLDQPVEGLLVFAKNKEAAAKLSAQGAASSLKKVYRARIYGLVEGSGELTDYLIKNGKTNLSEISDKNNTSAQKAELKYRVLCNDEETSLVEIELITGRHHQIRAQFANFGHPLLGDSKYGNDESREYSLHHNVSCVALCAMRLSLRIPKSKQIKEFNIIPENPLLV